MVSDRYAPVPMPMPVPVPVWGVAECRVVAGADAGTGAAVYDT